MTKQKSFTSDNPKLQPMSTAEKVLSFPARAAIFGGLAAGTAAEQYLHDKKVISSRSPTIQAGKGYTEAKKMARTAVGIDPIDTTE